MESEVSPIVVVVVVVFEMQTTTPSVNETRFPFIPNSNKKFKKQFQTLVESIKNSQKTKTSIYNIQKSQSIQ